MRKGARDDENIYQNPKLRRGQSQYGSPGAGGAGAHEPDGSEGEYRDSAPFYMGWEEAGFPGRLDPARLQEALILETDLEKCIILAELLDREANRITNEQNINRMIIFQNDRFIFTSGINALYLSSVFNMLKWAAPALLTYALAHWMFQFYLSANGEGAATCKELLLVLAGGTLGWIANRKGG